MNPIIQPGTHPDSESLTAFAEQLLGGAEREQVVAHMAACSRCREIVFLAQQAMDADLPVQAKQAVTEKTSRGWFRGWRWAWIPVAALAGFIGFAAIEHVRQSAPEQQLARSEPQPEVIKGALTAGTASAPATPQAAKRDQAATLSAAPQTTPTIKENRSIAVPENKKATSQDRLEQRASPVNTDATFVGGAMHGTNMARAKSSAMGGPMAQNQMQQSNASEVNSQQQAQAYTANKAFTPTPAASPAPPARPVASSETVEVQSASQMATVSAAPTATPQIAVVPATGRNIGVASNQLAKLSDSKVKLPGGLETLSVARTARRAVAIDTAGALFVSEDGGKHWQPVQTQWTGRAALVRTHQAGSESAALLSQQAPRFELVNDQLQTWVSTDGKTWTAQAVPEK